MPVWGVAVEIMNETRSTNSGFWRFGELLPLMILISPLLASAIAGLVTWLMPDVYESPVGGYPTNEPLRDNPEEAPEWVKNERAFIGSKSAMERLIDDLALEKTWQADRAKVRRLLQQSVEVFPIRSSDLVGIRVRHRDRFIAKLIAENLVRQYSEDWRRRCDDYAERARLETRKESMVEKQGMFVRFSEEVIVHELPIVPEEPVPRDWVSNQVAGVICGFLLSPVLALLLWGWQFRPASWWNRSSSDPSSPT